MNLNVKLVSVVIFATLALSACGTDKVLEQTPSTFNTKTNVLPTSPEITPTTIPETQTNSDQDDDLPASLISNPTTSAQIQGSNQNDYTPAPTSSPIVTSTPTATKKTYTLADIGLHATASNCWTAIHGNVYDMTQFIPSHPGGRAIIQACGKDGTALFEDPRGNGRAHPQGAQNILDQFLIGTVQ